MSELFFSLALLYACLPVYELSIFCCFEFQYSASIHWWCCSCLSTHATTLFQFERKKTPQLYLICIMVVFITTVMLSSCCFLQKSEPNYSLIWKIVSRHFSFTHSLYSISLFQSQWMQMKFLQQIPNIAEQLQHLTLSQSLRMISIVTVFESNWMRNKLFIWITLKRKLKNLLSSAISALFYIIK